MDHIKYTKNNEFFAKDKFNASLKLFIINLTLCT